MSISRRVMPRSQRNFTPHFALTSRRPALLDALAREALIRVYGDSLSLPRADGGVTYRQTYCEVLVDGIRTRFPQLALSCYNRSGGGLTVTDLHERYLHDCSYFGMPQHQVLVVQCGVVDCAPRPTPAFLRRLIGKLPGRIRAPITAFLHHSRPWLLRAGLSWRLTSPHRFTQVLSRWLAHAANQSERVYVLNIAPTVPSIAVHSPGFEQSIVAYNALIAAAVAATPSDAVILIDVHETITRKGDVPTWISPSDGHHLTVKGNLLYAELILRHELQRLGAGPKEDYG
jgi:hypothetical protein